MEIFNIGLGEMLVILVLALLVFGPERLPEIARQIGKTIRTLQEMSGEVTQVIQESMAEVEEPMRETQRALEDTQKTLSEEVNKATRTVSDELTSATSQQQSGTPRTQDSPDVDVSTTPETAEDDADAFDRATDEDEPRTTA